MTKSSQARSSLPEPTFNRSQTYTTSSTIRRRLPTGWFTSLVRLACAHQHARHVVVLRGVADEEVEIDHNPAKQFGRRCRCARLQNRQQPLFPVFLIAIVHRFDQPVGKDDEPIAALQTNRARLVHRRLLNPQRQSAGLQAFDPSRGAAQNRYIVSCIDVSQGSCGRFVLSEEGRREAQTTLAEYEPAT